MSWSIARFEAYCGFSSDEILGGAFLEKLSKEQVQIISAVDQQAIESQQTTTSEVVRVFESPSESRFYKVKRLATYDDSGPRHLITLREDITDQREAAIALNEALAAAQQASQAKSAFLANISHEIRTPLNGIVASADLLRKTALSDQGRELLDMIAASGLVLERLLADLLDFTTLQSSDVVIQAAAFNLHEWVGALVDKARPKAAAKGLDLHLRFTPPAQPWVLGDAVRTGQVLNRLIENALKFTDHGHISVSVAPSAEGRIRFEVADTGIGFDPKDYARIFDQFQQGDESATRRFGGSGLGLAISRPLVERMGGVLECHSQKGRGSTFWFELPLPSCTDPGALKSPEAPPKPLTSRLRVLIADDHPINRKILEMMLGDVADVCMVENGLEAVRAYGAQAHDLILMDIQMPVMDGLAAVREIRRLERERSVHTPIIMVSANALSEHVSAAIQAGADLHLAKPVTAARLFSAIDAVLSKRSTFSQAR